MVVPAIFRDFGYQSLARFRASIQTARLPSIPGATWHFCATAKNRPWHCSLLAGLFQVIHEYCQVPVVSRPALFDRAGLVRRLKSRQANWPRGLRGGIRRARHGQRLGAGGLSSLSGAKSSHATYHGGARCRCEAQAVFLGSAWTSNSTLQTESAALDNFLSYAVQSPYLDMLTDAGTTSARGRHCGRQNQRHADLHDHPTPRSARCCSRRSTSRSCSRRR